MKRWIILTIIILMIPLAVALPDICEDTLITGRNCTMLTPSLTCGTYNYTIYNQSEFVNNGTLTLLDESIYYFIFNESEGDYIVRLCDGSTRELVVEGDEMLNTASVIALVLFGILFIIVGIILFLRGRG